LGNVVVEWQGPFHLQTADSLSGPIAWQEVPGGSSPVTVPASLGQRFFRTVSLNGSCSPNIAAYINVAIPGNGAKALISIPLNGTNNHLNTVLPLPSSADGSFIERFRSDTQSLGDAITWMEGLGWFSPDPDEDFIIAPGEAFWIHNSGPAMTLTFVGDVPQGNLSNSIPANLSLRSSIAPLQGQLSGLLGFAAEDGDQIYVFDVPIQNYKDTYSYIASIGWISSNTDDAGPLGPVIPIATGFVLQKAGSAGPWVQTFNPGDCRQRPLLGTTLSPGNFTITWSGGGVLEASSNLTTWTAVPGASSPFSVEPNEEKAFFRVRR